MNQTGDLQGSWCSERVQCSLFLRSQKSNRWLNYPDISGFLGRPSDQPLVAPAGRHLNSSLMGQILTRATLLFGYTTVAPREAVENFSAFPLTSLPAKKRGPRFLDALRLGCIGQFRRPSVSLASVELLFECGTAAAGAPLTPRELPDAPWHRARRPLRGCPLRLRSRWERSSGPGVSTREPVTLAIGSTLAALRAECVPGEGDLEHSFCAAPAHTHMCAESHRGLSANYRLKSDREKLGGKGTAAGSWWTAEGRGEGRGGLLDFVLNPSNPLPRTLKTKFNHLGVLPRSLIPLKYPRAPAVPVDLSDEGVKGQSRQMISPWVFTGRPIFSLN